ncbi:MAG: sugar phosphate nucleotidyltransferase [Syntrophomonadaceae bacterium]|jgi:mannose-1-phosphate guanylyltransferase
MKAMIMAAGVGSRLMPLTMDIPKPMIPMANRPLMEIIVELLSNHEFNNIISNLHYQADYISSYFGEGKLPGVSMLYSQEEELMGTAGGVKNCEWFLDETFVIMSGDALTDVDLGRLLQEHRRKGALATIAVKEVADVQHFGVVVSDEQGRILRFQEKPRPEEALSNLANTGIYIFEPEIFKYIPSRQFYDFGKQVFPHLVKNGAPFYAVPISDYWCDVGNLDTYRQSHADILEQKVRVGLRGEKKELDTAMVLQEANTQIDPQAQLRGKVVLGANTCIEAGAILNNCVIWDNTYIGRGAHITDAVIGSGCHIGQNVSIMTGTVVASHCNIGEAIQIGPNRKVFNTAGGELELEQG